MPPDTSEAVEIALIRADLDSLKDKVTKQNEQLADLLQAWQTANGMLSIIRFLAMVGGGILAIVAYMKGVK